MFEGENTENRWFFNEFKGIFSAIRATARLKVILIGSFIIKAVGIFLFEINPDIFRDYFLKLLWKCLHLFCKSLSVKNWFKISGRRLERFVNKITEVRLKYHIKMLYHKTSFSFEFPCSNTTILTKNALFITSITGKQLPSNQSMPFYVKFHTSQSGRQLSSCYSRLWFLKYFFASLTVFLFLELLCSNVWLFLVTQLLLTECFSWARIKIFSCCYDWQLSSFFNLSPSSCLFYSEIVKGM